MAVIERQFGRKVILSVSLIAIGFLAGHYQKDFAQFREPRKIKQIKNLVREQKAFEAVLVALETIGEDIDEDGTVSEPIEKSLQHTVPVLRERQRFPKDINAYVFRPGTTGHFVTGHRDGLIRFWQSDGTLTEKTIQTKGNNKSAVWEIAFDSEGKKMLVGKADGELQIWDVDRSTLLDSWSLGMTPSQLVVSPDGKVIVAAGGEKGGAIGVWDNRGKVIRAPKQVHWLYANNIVFTPDGQKFVTSDIWGRVLHWSRDGRLLNQLNSENRSTNYNKFTIFFPFESTGKYYYYISNLGLYGGFLEEEPTPLEYFGSDIDKLYIPDFNRSNSNNNKFILQKPQIWDADSNGRYFVVGYADRHRNNGDRKGFIQAYAPFDRPVGNLIMVEEEVYGLTSNLNYVAGKVLNEKEFQLRLWEYSETPTEDGWVLPPKANKYGDWESLLEHSCSILKSHAIFNNPVTETEKNAVAACKNHGQL